MKGNSKEGVARTRKWAATATKLFPYKGEQLTLAAIAEREGIQPWSVYGRWLRCKRTEARPTRTFSYNGQQCPIKVIAEAEGVTEVSISNRIKRGGSALTMAARGLRCPKFEYHGELLHASEIARREGVSKQAINQRIATSGTAMKKPRQAPYKCGKCGRLGHTAKRSSRCGDGHGSAEALTLLPQAWQAPRSS